MKATTVKETLIAMRWILDRYGWCQGHYHVDKSGKPLDNLTAATPHNLGGSCLSGAMTLVDTEDEYIYNQAASAILLKVGSVVAWNDKPGRTKEEVLDLLDNLIAKA